MASLRRIGDHLVKLGHHVFRTQVNLDSQNPPCRSGAPLHRDGELTVERFGKLRRLAVGGDQFLIGIECLLKLPVFFLHRSDGKLRCGSRAGVGVKRDDLFVAVHGGTVLAPRFRIAGVCQQVNRVGFRCLQLLTGRHGGDLVLFLADAKEARVGSFRREGEC